MGSTQNDLPLFVITGGPASGKTTLISALGEAGYRCSVEAGRRIIKEQMAIEGRALPWIDPLLFAEMMLMLDIEAWRALSPPGAPAFFDRGIPDTIGYLTLERHPVPGHMMRAARLFRYQPRVFICPPWPEIFAQDTERRQTLDEARRTYDAMVGVYSSLGYDLLEVPRLPVAERARFVLSHAV